MSSWFEEQIRERLSRYDHHPDRIPVSVKLRVTGGNFRYDQAPRPMELTHRMRELRHDLDPDHRHDFHDRDEEIQYEQHESGPEWIIYVAAGAAVLSVTANFIQLITAVIQAWSEYQKSGKGSYHDHTQQLEFAVRGIHDGKLFDGVVKLIKAGDKPTEKEIEAALLDGLKTITIPANRIKPATRKKIEPTTVKMPKKTTKKATKKKKKK